MTLTALAALRRCAQDVAYRAHLALYTDCDWHEKELQSALAKFDEARAALTAAQAPERGTLDPHGGDA